eukprot:531319_1
MAPVCMIVVEVIHVILVGINILTDSIVLNEMIGYKSSFESYQNIVQNDQYKYSFCYPTLYEPGWYLNFSKTQQPQYNQSCICNEINVECIGSENYSEIDIITNYTLHDDTKMVLESETNCDMQFWGYPNAYEHPFKIDSWICQDCTCFDDMYDFDTSLPIQKLLYKYNLLSVDQQNSYCTPYSMIHDIDDKHMPNQINIYVICSWVFIFIGSITQCIGICFRAGFIYDSKDDLDHDAKKTGQYVSAYALRRIKKKWKIKKNKINQMKMNKNKKFCRNQTKQIWINLQMFYKK